MYDAPKYTYDAENRMTAAAGVTYTYDGDGKRVMKSTAGTPPQPYKLYWYGAGSDPLAESDAAGNLTDEYVFFSGKRIARRNVATNEIHYSFADHLGSSRVVTNATGQVLDDSDFYPFGGERPVLSASGNLYKFTGKERDAESGLDYFGARYYAPTLGRFVTPDPLMASGRASSPQSWNRYTYVLNNPLNLVDPDGLEDKKEDCSGSNDCIVIKVKVNIIYDATANRGKGLSEQQKKDFEKRILAKAEKDFGKSNIKFDITYMAGSYTADKETGKVSVTGLRQDSLNVVVSSDEPGHKSGSSLLLKDTGGIFVSFINIKEAHSSNVFLWSNTMEHEISHHLQGHTAGEIGLFTNFFADTSVDSRLLFQSLGVRQDALRNGAHGKAFSVPPSQSANEPQKKP